MPSQKSKIAFRFNVESMKENLYFWTFTFVEALDIKEAARRWHSFLHQHGLLEAFPNVAGLRVFEMHPGTGLWKLSHGLHIHAVINDYIPVDIVRSISTRKGFGRINVKRIPRKDAMYLGKYLAKERQECFGRTRLWAAFGVAETHKVKDIVVDSRWTDSYKFLAKVIGNFSSLPWSDRLHIVSRFSLGENCEHALRQCGYFDRSEEEWRAARQDELEEDPRL